MLVPGEEAALKGDTQGAIGSGAGANSAQQGRLVYSPFYAQYNKGVEDSTGPATLCCCGTMVGNSRLLCGDVRAKGWGRVFPFICHVGPDWPCNICTWLLVGVPSITFTAFIAPQLHIGLVVAEIALIALTFATLALTAWSNPGILPPQSAQEAEDERLKLMEEGRFDHTLCGRCNVWREGGAIHCRANGVCIAEYDHHCPWMGKAVGRDNLYFFYAFLYSMCTLLAVTGVSGLVWLVQAGAT